MSEDRFQLLRLLEAILFASTEPMAEKTLAARLPEGADIPGLLQELAGLYANRGVHLMQFGDRWAFRTAPDLGERLQTETVVARKLSRAAIETLAIVAYHQPVTRAEVEEIRGVALSRGTLDTLLEANWIRPKGRRQTPGRPVTWVTTDAFLDHFGLESREALPGIEELKAAGLLDARSAISTLGAQAMAAVPPPEDEGEEENEAGEDAAPGDDEEAAADFESMIAGVEATVEEEDEEEPRKG
jgi:segregation and condensation protein B